MQSCESGTFQVHPALVVLAFKKLFEICFQQKDKFSSGTRLYDQV